MTAPAGPRRRTARKTAGTEFGYQGRKKRVIDPIVCIAHRRRAGLPARRGAAGEKIQKIDGKPTSMARPVPFLPAIVVPRGAGTINALMASGESIRLEALTQIEGDRPGVAAADRQWGQFELALCKVSDICT